MYLITEARFLAKDIKLFKIEAPRIAEKRKAGQFVIIRVNETGERIPLTIADSDRNNGTITIIVQGVAGNHRIRKIHLVLLFFPPAEAEVVLLRPELALVVFALLLLRLFF